MNEANDTPEEQSVKRHRTKHLEVAAPLTTKEWMWIAICAVILIAILVTLMVLEINSARTPSRGAMSMSLMRQMAFAMHNHHAAQGAFPTAGFDENGVGPNLSWRVHILPYIEEKTLYEKFHLDEPWDSPHNKSLIQYMPYAYELPNGSLDPGKTVYLAVTGPGAAFQGGEVGPALEDFTDGISKTIILVEVDTNSGD